MWGEDVKLENWSLIAEITGGIAVVISVVILIVEVRGNTAAIRAASAQSITDATVNVMTQMAADEELTSLRVAGDQTIREPFVPTFGTRRVERELSDTDRWRYLLYYRQLWIRFQNNYLQSRSGALSPGIWDTYAAVICFDMADSSRPGVKATWPDHAQVLVPEFVDVVESCPDF